MIGSSAPVLTSARLRMNIAPMVSGAGFAKTASALSTGSTPSAISVPAPAIAVTSGGYCSRTKRTNMIASTHRVTIAGTGSGNWNKRPPRANAACNPDSGCGATSLAVPEFRPPAEAGENRVTRCGASPAFCGVSAGDRGADVLGAVPLAGRRPLA